MMLEEKLEEIKRKRMNKKMNKVMSYVNSSHNDKLRIVVNGNTMHIDVTDSSQVEAPYVFDKSSFNNAGIFVRGYAPELVLNDDVDSEAERVPVGEEIDLDNQELVEKLDLYSSNQYQNFLEQKIVSEATEPVDPNNVWEDVPMIYIWLIIGALWLTALGILAGAFSDPSTATIPVHALLNVVSA